jgi:transcriptional regulator with XRE-family HTH domain
MEENLINTFGRNVRALRLKLGYSQEKLAEVAGLHRTYIGMIERAEKNITLNNVEKLAKALNVLPSELFRQKMD